MMDVLEGSIIVVKFILAWQHNNRNHNSLNALMDKKVNEIIDIRRGHFTITQALQGGWVCSSLRFILLSVRWKRSKSEIPNFERT